MAFTIESNIPVPTATRIRARGDFSTACDTLEVGQSFFAPGKSIKGAYASVSPTKFPGKKFKVAVIAAVAAVEGVDGAESTPGTPEGLRIWRVQ